jgi:hypothetical protein
MTTLPQAILAAKQAATLRARTARAPSIATMIVPARFASKERFGGA